MSQKEITFEFVSPQHGQTLIKLSEVVNISFCELYGAPALRIFIKNKQVFEVGFANKERRQAVYQEFRDQLDVRTFEVQGWVSKSGDSKQSGIPPR